MISLEAAENIIEQSSQQISETEVVDLNYSRGRVLAEDVVSDIDLPPFNKSAMDGYACRREDISQPMVVLETIAAGMTPAKTIQKGQCAKIMTGAKIPVGANCVIKIEDTSRIDENKIIFTGHDSLDNICFKGEDLTKDVLVISKGTIINPQITGILASVGLTKVKVTKKIQVGFFCTGSELVEPEIIPSGVCIRNSNASQLIAQITATGAIPTYFGIIADDKFLIKDKLLQLIDSHHIIIITGGSSVGDFDFIPDVIHQSGYKIQFQKVRIQPGKPIVYGTKDNKHIFGLSGNPVSSFLQFELLVKPLIFKLSAANYRVQSIKLVTDETITRKITERKQFIPVVINNSGHIKIPEFHGSAHLGALKDIFGFVIIPEGISEIKKGEFVNVRPI